MQYATSRFPSAQNIACVSGPQIQVPTDKIKTMPFPSGNAKSPGQMLGVIATALQMSHDSYQAKARNRNLVDLRFLGALMLRRYYPEVTLKQIALFFGGQDHTTVINAIIRANELLATRDFVFTSKYNRAVISIGKWLNEN